MKNAFILFALAVIGGAGYLLYLDLHVPTPSQVSVDDMSLNKSALVDKSPVAVATPVLIVQPNVSPIPDSKASPTPKPAIVAAIAPLPSKNTKSPKTVNTKPLPLKPELKKMNSLSPTPTPTPTVTPSPTPTQSPTPTPTATPKDDKSPTFVILNPKDQIELTRDLTMNKPDAIVFQWQTTKPLPGPVTLAVSHDPQFSDPFVVNNIKKTSAAVTLKKEGIYYWNLTSQSSDGSNLEISPALTFNLKSAGGLTAPTSVSPKDGDNIEAAETVPVVFKWKAGKNAIEYHVVVKRTDPTTKEQFIVADQNLAATTFTSEALEHGSYSWMVIAKDSKNREKSFAREMTFNIAAPFQMAPPKLKEPVVK